MPVFGRYSKSTASKPNFWIFKVPCNPLKTTQSLRPLLSILGSLAAIDQTGSFASAEPCCTKRLFTEIARRQYSKRAESQLKVGVIPANKSLSLKILWFKESLNDKSAPPCPCID